MTVTDLMMHVRFDAENLNLYVQIVIWPQIKEKMPHFW